MSRCKPLLPRRLVTFVPRLTRLAKGQVWSIASMQQSVRYLKTADGVQLAWATMGGGTRLIKAANWLTHLQYDLESPVWLHWIRFFATHVRFTRYDERGCGMTQWQVPDVSLARWIDDLDAVAAASEPQGRMAVLGISQGAATSIGYAVRHPDRVSHLILYGGYATGWALRGDEDGLRRYRAIVELIRLGWGSENVAFRQVFTSRFVPDASAEQIEWFNDLCRRTTTPEIAAHLMLARSEIDVRELLHQVRVPTLVIHAADDSVTPISASRELAAGIPNAEFVQLESRNHVLLEHEPAWARFKQIVLEFTGQSGAHGRDDRFAALSGRERDVLGGLVSGRSNAEIAASLHIGDKTVRNIVSRIFDKLGVHSRAQAIVMARDQGFDAAGTKKH
jgi:pimeloyl-ACP methyl ester carboxylesterase/DNA-binding CsgD family transcriptional regulator